MSLNQELIHSRSSSPTSLHDRLSIHSFVTASSGPKLLVIEDNPPRYIEDPLHPPIQEKSLPSIPYNEKPKYQEYFDPYNIEEDTKPSSSTSTNRSIHPLTTTSQLSNALGPDNLICSTEIDTIPCSGVRVPHGPLNGLLAWRLVVRKPSRGNEKEKRTWCQENAHIRRMSDAPPLPPSYLHPSKLSVSTTSLPLPLGATTIPISHSHNLTRGSRIHLHRPAYGGDHAVVVNFILDTSLPYSIISRDTLIALGYPSHRFPSLDPHSQDREEDSNSNIYVNLVVQNIPTRLCIARPGEASRLGVQFLHDASVSVFFPKDGEGVGPVLYYESARLLRDVPPTISLSNNARGLGMLKLNLPQRVRAFFGLT